MSRKSARNIAAGCLVVGAVLGADLTVAAAADDETTLTTQATRLDAAATTQGNTKVTGRISEAYAEYFGAENSKKLVTGLREGSAISLSGTSSGTTTTGTTTTTATGTGGTTFTSPTGKMGYGNVSISLALAEQQLAAQGITSPTPEQIQAVLVGGTVNGTTYPGILQMRASGMGWGRIAQSLGVKLGPTISAVKSQGASLVAAKPSRTTTAGTSTTDTANVGTTAGATTGSKTGTPQKPVVRSSGIVTAAGSPVGGVATRSTVNAASPASGPVASNAGRGRAEGATANGGNGGGHGRAR